MAAVFIVADFHDHAVGIGVRPQLEDLIGDPLGTRRRSDDRAKPQHFVKFEGAVEIGAVHIDVINTLEVHKNALLRI